MKTQSLLLAVLLIATSSIYAQMPSDPLGGQPPFPLRVQRLFCLRI